MTHANSKVYGKALGEVLEGKSLREAREILARFKHFLKKRGQLRLAPSILRDLKSFQEEKHGKLAQLVSASQLPHHLRIRLKKSLEEKGFQMEEKIDPEIIGGTALLLGKEYMVDGTIRGRIQKIAKLLQL